MRCGGCQAWRRGGGIVHGYKTAIVILAFLPQFVALSRSHVAMQVAVLGLLFMALGFVTDGCYDTRRRRGD